MSLLQVKQVRKNAGSNVLIPYINFEVKQGQCVTIQCNHELGYQLLETIVGQISISDGEILRELQSFSMKRFQAIVQKEWKDSIRNRQVLTMTAFLIVFAILFSIMAIAIPGVPAGILALFILINLFLCL